MEKKKDNITSSYLFLLQKIRRVTKFKISLKNIYFTGSRLILEFKQKILFL